MAEVAKAAGSLRGRLLLRLVVLLAVILAVSSLAAYLNGRRLADVAYDRTLLASARTIAAGLSATNGTLRADVPYIALDNFAYDNVGRIFYQVLDTRGRLISGYEEIPPPPADAPLTRDYPALARFYNSTYRGKDVRVVSLAQPVSQPDLTGMAEIRVAETAEAREEVARSLLTDTLIRLGLMGLGAILLVWMAVGAALRPLERLRQAVEERGVDDLRPLPEVRAPQELLPLVHALEGFTLRLRRLFERQADFIANAAHELRTPLAAIKARVELGLREREPQAWYATLEETRASTDRLARLANQLLSLARIESGAQAIAEGGAERLELSDLARELAMALAPLAHAKGVALAFEPFAKAPVIGEPTLLNELLCNLVENALAHSQSGGNIVVRVLAPAVLEVEDDGPGIPANARAKVFERFQRLDPQSGGAGLGLAIVGEICAAHRARIQLLDGALGGLRVRVEFPAEEA
ncbi:MULTISPECIES: sensor histidine kinase [Pseudomonadaceae]|uniref:histidine kinase n=4 Tax=Pseudomonadaceae TaxID=135621 RepID=A0A1G5PEJ5_9PSED|nr:MULTISPECIES: sensor histidine kinase [Pseudomonas]EHK69732.1 sensory histidine protein kinase TctE [Pseudomonas psychrotolerans L19]MBA1181396.1 sensor histidine kinase [Pseudomonas psychrotolerans]MBA1212835.1 sensor histidine kinase [Pseudomonas psychrotolerans]MBA1260523.1 sensor histidine kinase [Pseudomonas psychrotolerans]MBH3332389.1 sensor histidine kinase [Pseudomonas oryzihabitans]